MFHATHRGGGEKKSLISEFATRSVWKVAEKFFVVFAWLS